MLLKPKANRHSIWNNGHQSAPAIFFTLKARKVGGRKPRAYTEKKKVE